MDLPVQVRGADEIGAIAFELVYDATLLDPTLVDPDELAKGANAGFNDDNPGRLVVVVQNAPSIDGDGTLVTIQFDVLRDSGTSDLVLENVQARSLATLEFVSPMVQPGNVVAEDLSYVAPTFVFGS